MTTPIQANNPNLTGQHTHSGGFGEDGLVRCGHGYILNVLTSQTPKNPGRRFYICPKAKGDPQNCKFFMWEDDGFTEKAREMTTPVAKRPHPALETPATSSSSPINHRKDAGVDAGRFRFDVNQKDIDDILNSDDEPQQKKFKTSIQTYGNTPKVPAGPSLGTVDSVTPQRSQREVIRDDPENPFHDRASSESSHRHAQVTNTPSVQDSPTNVQGTEPITTIMGGLQNLTEQIRKLERLRLAAEKSRDSKARRIAELQKEVEDLTKRNKSLEEELEALT